MQASVTINGTGVAPSLSFPEPLSDHHLYGSRCFYFTDSYGYLLAQSLDANPYALLYTIAAVQKKVRIRISCLEVGFVCHFTFGKSLSVHSSQTGSTIIHAQSLMLLFSPDWVVTADLKENGSYRSLTLTYPAAVVLERLRLFPLLEELQNDIRASKPFYMPDAVYPLSTHLIQMLNQLLQVPYTFLSKEFYHSLLMSVLSEVFAHLQSGTVAATPFTLTDIDAIRSAKQWIDNHLDTHFTISQLARESGINEFKLKKGFKEIYGIGLYGYLLRQRLHIARINLEQTNKPIRQVARQAGYQNAANFSAAFKRQFGITPHRFRKQSRS